MMRPVVNLKTCTIEYIGTLEQLYLNVAVSPEDIEDGVCSNLLYLSLSVSVFSCNYILEFVIT